MGTLLDLAIVIAVDADISVASSGVSLFTKLLIKSLYPIILLFSAIVDAA